MAIIRAAYRYTNVRDDGAAGDGTVRDLDKDTVDFQPNYDNSEHEPVVLPAAYPNLLVNGAGGIRGRHGDQHPAAQSRRSHRCLRGVDRQSRALGSKN